MADQKDKLWTCISCGNENPIEDWDWSCHSCGKANWKEIRDGLPFICVFVSIAAILLAIAVISSGGWQAFNQKGMGLLTIIVAVTGFIAVLNLGLILAKLGMTFWNSNKLDKRIIYWSLGIVGFILIMGLGYYDANFKKPPQNRPESFSAYKLEMPNNSKLFTVYRESFGPEDHFYFSDHDSGLLFMDNPPSQLNLNLFLTYGTGGLNKVHKAYVISHDIKTVAAWNLDFTKGAKDGSWGSDTNELFFDNATDMDVIVKYGENVLPVLSSKHYAVVYLFLGEHHFVIQNAKTNETIDEFDVLIEYSNQYLFYIYNVNSLNNYKILYQEYKRNK